MKRNSVLAENKLSILYFIHILNIPLTNSQITRFFVENNLINYFELQQLLIQLVSAGLLNCIESMNKHLYTITQEGIKTLNLFKQRISPSIRELIESYGSQNRNKLKKEAQIFSEYRKLDDNNYEVICRIIEQELALFEIKINVISSTLAKSICNKWKERGPEIYRFIVEKLIT